MDIVGNGVFVAAMDRPRVRRRLTLPVLAVAVVSATAVAAVAWQLARPPERVLRVDASRITVSAVSMAAFREFIPVRGQVEPLSTVALDAVEGGRVEEVLAEAGQKVVAGQPLIRLSEPSLELEAIARETQIIEQINNQRSLELNFEQTKTSDAKALVDADYNIMRLGRLVSRRQPLAAHGFASQEMLDQAADELDYQQRLKKIAEDAVERDAAVITRSEALIGQTAARLDANLAIAKGQLDALTVRAPTDGLLTSLDAHVGEEKNCGQHLGQIDRDGGFKVTMQVDEFYLARVRPGQGIAATIDGARGDLLVAKVYPQVKDGVFTIDLSWRGAEPAGLRRGQTIQGKLALGDDGPAVVLPAGAFLQTSGGTWVFVVNRDGTSAERRSVKLGRRTTETVEVLSGLAPGDRVVTSDYAGFERIDRLALSS